MNNIVLKIRKIYISWKIGAYVEADGSDTSQKRVDKHLEKLVVLKKQNKTNVEKFVVQRKILEKLVELEKTALLVLVSLLLALVCDVSQSC